jgi:integrase
MARRFPNGYGGITRLKGKRSKPYMAYVSEMVCNPGADITPKLQKDLGAKIEAIKEASDIEDISEAYAGFLCELFTSTGTSADDYKEMLLAEAEKEIKKRTFKQKQVKKAIGYFKTSQEANIALAEYNKNPFDIDKRKITFREVYELAYKDAKIDSKSVSSIKGYRSSIAKCESVNNMLIAEVKYTHLQAIIDSYSDKSASTLNNIMLTFSLIYSYAMKNELVDKNAAEFVKINEHKEKGEKMPFTREEVNYLWDHLDWTYKSKRTSKLDGETLSDILLILIYTGMRIEELLNVKSDEVHITERYIDLRGTKTKAAKRLIPIHKKIEPLIESRLAMGGEYLIVSKLGERIRYTQLTQSMLKLFSEETKINHNFHEARHSFATYTKASQLEPTLRQFIMGHANKDITDDIYTHPEVLLPELIKEIDKLDI